LLADKLRIDSSCFAKAADAIRTYTQIFPGLAHTVHNLFRQRLYFSKDLTRLARMDPFSAWIFRGFLIWRRAGIVRTIEYAAW
jgi:hypothetical protein